MKKINVLAYVREYFKRIYLPMLAAVPGAHIDLVTDFPTDRMENLRDLFYRKYSKEHATRPHGLDVEDVIRRCRLLRNIDSATATSMVIAMHSVIEDLMSRNEYDVVLGQMVDDYITHLFSLAAEARGIKYVGLCGSYFHGYSQITQYAGGAPLEWRPVSDDEANDVLVKVSAKAFRMDYGQPTKYSYPRHLSRVSRYWVKRLTFSLLKHYKRDPLNYHYMVQPYLGQPKRVFDFPKKGAFNNEWESAISKSKKPLVYLPLAYFPEASTDYWVPNPRFLRYEDAVCDIALHLTGTHTVIVKEHLHMLGSRAVDFYARLNSLAGVISLPPTVNSNVLLGEHKPTVLVGGGSVGLEATLRGLPVVTFCPTSFWCAASQATVITANSDSDIATTLLTARAADVDPLELVRRCLASMLTFDFMEASTLPSSALSQLRTFLAKQ